MTVIKFILNNLRGHFRAHLFLIIGIAISTTVIIGALMVGESVTHSLIKSAELRLGQTTHTVTAGERFFTDGFGERMTKLVEGSVSALLLSDALASKPGGVVRLNQIQVLGCNNDLLSFGASDLIDSLGKDEVLISPNLATRLGIQKGDEFILKFSSAGLIPANAPFIAEEQEVKNLHVKVREVLSNEELARFNLKNIQTAPFNVFLRKEILQELLDLKDRSNVLLLATNQHRDEIDEAIDKAFQLQDAGLKVQFIEATKEWEVLSDRLFIDTITRRAFAQADRPVLTYFANRLQHDERGCPYSFVSSHKGLKGNDIWINSWLADDIRAKPGDTVQMTYFKVGPLRRLAEASELFVVQRVVPDNAFYWDATLMPQIPGLYDAGSCTEWEAGIPIDLTAIRDKDEAYWNDHKGTPKAFLAHDKALELFANRFGSYTALRYNESQRASIDDDFNSLKPQDLGWVITPVRDQAMDAAIGGVDFGQLFMGLSFFLVLAGLILCSSLFINQFEFRKKELGLLSSLGFSHSQIFRLFYAEHALLSIVGALFGVGGGIWYNQFVFSILNSNWNAIVRTDLLVVHLDVKTLIAGFAVSLGLLLFILWLLQRKAFKKGLNELQREVVSARMDGVNRVVNWLGKGFVLVSLVLLALQFLAFENTNPGLFFGAAFFLLVGLLIEFTFFLKRTTVKSTAFFQWRALIYTSVRRNRRRSSTIVSLFAIGTFLVLTTGLNRKDVLKGASELRSGTGGFELHIESTIPFWSDLNDSVVQQEMGFTTNFKTVMFRKLPGDDASCLNLNRITQPAILGVKPELLQERFSFATRTADVDLARSKNPWLSLKEKNRGNVINGIADQTVIKWSLGKNVGDTLVYATESGHQLKIRLIAGLANSVFQGHVIIDEEQLLRFFPTHSGANWILLETEDADMVSEEFLNLYRDKGLVITNSKGKLLEFYSVEETYLSIFMALGILAIVLGMFGLGVVLARSLFERRKELASFKSMGYSNGSVFRLIYGEYVFLLIAGLFIGGLTAVVAVIPVLASSDQSVSLLDAIVSMLLLITNGLVWILLITWWRLPKLNIKAALQGE
jgi:ABC-type antimicrobial peptide transport system permease subunit